MVNGASAPEVPISLQVVGVLLLETGISVAELVFTLEEHAASVEPLRIAQDPYLARQSMVASANVDP